MRVWMLLLLLSGALVIAFLFYRNHTQNPRLNVEPHAREEIEKAKRR